MTARLCLDCTKVLSKHNTVYRCRRCSMLYRWREQPGKTTGKAKASQVRLLSEVEAAWIGALVEGEGHISPLGFILGSTSVETIATLLRLVGDGHIHYKNDDNPKHQPQLCWQLRNAASAAALGEQIWPFLTSKQEVCQERVGVWRATAERCGL